MLNILDDYIQHFKSTNNKSLLAKIYGIYNIKSPLIKSVDIIVMQNTAILHKNENKLLEFDLKGSIVGRYSKCRNYFKKTK